MSYEKILKLIRTEIADAMLEDGDLSRKEVLDDLLEGIRADLEVDEDEEQDEPDGFLEEIEWTRPWSRLVELRSISRLP